MKKIIAVIGGAQCSPEAAEQAKEVGRLLASAGFVVGCGGGCGVMEAACEGACSAGGTTIGFLAGTDMEGANSHLTLAITTGMGELRNGLVVSSARAIVAVGGEYGTLSEIALALKAGKLVVGLGTWELQKRGERDGGIRIAHSPEEAVRWVQEQVLDKT